MPITHAFTDPKADGADATIVRPSDWNASHVGGDSVLRTQLGYTSIGASFEASPVTSSSVALKKKITLPSAGLLTAINIYLKGNGTNVGQAMAGIWADNAGAPGNLVGGTGVGAGVASSFDNGIFISSTGRWISIPINYWVAAAGDIWIGMLFAAAGGSAGLSIAYDSAGTDYSASTSGFYLHDGVGSNAAARKYSIYADFVAGASTGITASYGGGIASVVDTSGNHTTTSTTLVDIDATNFAVTFTAPANGKVLVRMSLPIFTATNTFALTSIGLREGSTIIAGPVLAARNMGGTTGEAVAVSYDFIITGLTPGSSHTYKGAHCTDLGTTQISATNSATPAAMTVNTVDGVAPPGGRTEATLGADVTLTTANTFYDGPTVTPAAGTYDVWARVTILAVTSSNINFHGRLIANGSATPVDEIELDISTVNTFHYQLYLSARVVADGVNPILIRAATGGSAYLMKRDQVNNSSSLHRATLLVLTRVS